MSINERENINEENSQEERRRRQDVFNSGLRRIGSFANLPNRGILRILPTIRTELMLNRTAENFGEYLSGLLFLIDNSIERHTNLIGDMRNRIVPANERREREN